jgi:glyoxylase-like metal-dependent hydrolase (beta-lactamase superfamily II)
VPIKPENRGLYPADWRTRIRPAILERAGHRCEVCGVADRAVIVRAGATWIADDGQVYCADTGRPIGCFDEAAYAGGRKITIILTIAHLDHDPTNNAPDNLRALCQRHHLAHDLDHHKSNAAATRRGRRAVGDLFEAAP